MWWGGRFCFSSLPCYHFHEVPLHKTRYNIVAIEPRPETLLPAILIVTAFVRYCSVAKLCRALRDSMIP